MICSLIFSQFYTLQEYGQDEKEGVPPDVRIACQVDETYQHVNGESWFDPSAIDSWLTEQEDGSIVCAAGDASGDPTLFRLDDVNGYYQQSIDSEQPVKLSLSESIYQGLFLQLVDTNMIGMFANANFLGVIILGAGFGIALNKLSKKSKLCDTRWEYSICLNSFKLICDSCFHLSAGWSELGKNLKHSVDGGAYGSIHVLHSVDY